jgi:hypothetical protein
MAAAMAGSQSGSHASSQKGSVVRAWRSMNVATELKPNAGERISFVKALFPAHLMKFK